MHKNYVNLSSQLRLPGHHYIQRTCGFMPMNMSSWSASRFTRRRHSAPRMPACITRAASSLATTTPAAMRWAASALLRLVAAIMRARSLACM